MVTRFTSLEDAVSGLKTKLSPAELRKWDEGELLGRSEYVVVAFGLTVRDIRLERGLTQMQLSELTGIQQREITRIENGNGNPTLKTMQKLLVALGQTLIVATDPTPAKLSRRAKAN